MKQQQQEQVRHFLEGFHLPRYRELPDFGIHLEQVVRYADRYTPGDLTASMVSNYVKQKLLPPPEKKCYSRDALAYLIFLSYIKTVMPMEDIRLLMEVQRETYSLETAYNYFCDEFENLLWCVCGLKEQPDEVGVTHTEAKALLRTALYSIAYKVYLDECMKMVRETMKNHSLPTGNA